MNDVSDGGQRLRNGPARAVLLAAVLAGTALPAAACSGGGQPAAGSSTGSAQTLAQRLDSYAKCMRANGEPGFYFSRQAGPPSPDGLGLFIHGYVAPGIDPGSAQFGSANKVCMHLLPVGTPPTAAELHQQLTSAVKSAACMRAHGYPGYPDPKVLNGRVAIGFSTGIDVSAPQFQAAAKTCGEPVPPGAP